ncbi:hypothetical protein J7K27_03630 [Candidatus Bathyarchaeota archaeon]|nr:hypothetical protein [Candidatus Bathyarchaeota archaeon]
MKDWRKNFRKLDMVRGWLFDVYPSGPNEMTVWIIAENGERLRFVDRFTRKIYVSGKIRDLQNLTKHLVGSKSVKAWRFVEKQADLMDSLPRKVLEIDITDYRRIPYFARKLLRLGGYEKFRLHNVDVPASQAYLYEKDIFPLAYLGVVDSGNRLSYTLYDSVESIDYVLPPLRTAWLHVYPRRSGAVPSFNDPIEAVTLEVDNKTIVVNGKSEADKILGLVEAIKREDPDVIFTHGGDSYLFPYLAHRAFVNGILDRLILSREDIPVRAKRSRGRTFFSYGRVYHKAPIRRLFGRVHIDVDNTFIYAACGIEGLIEVARTCRVPLHRVARASIGSIMTSLQLYIAWKDGILIPWKKREPESFKSAWELLVADRGGFIYEPKIGIHDEVYEVDFTSMFPMLMLTRNISAETVLCRCCPDSKLRVPELGYNICEKRKGIVPKTLDLLLRKRLKYKELWREAKDEKLRRIYNSRQEALKWILVTCFGYLGYRNARFGKVDAHIAVCAFAREALLKTARMAEERGFEIIHGIVDSLWIRKPGAAPKEVVNFCQEVSKEIGVPLSVEGKYRWIVFLPSKVLGDIPVLNRYYGVFENGKVKMRGIEARRRDTPPFIAEAQMSMINELAKARNSKEFAERIPLALRKLRAYAEALINRRVAPQRLLITKQLSHEPADYVHDVFQAIAAKQLARLGVDVSAGQTVQYLICDAKNRKAYNRIRVAQLLDANTRYDVEKYLDLLFAAAENILLPFGYSVQKIRDYVRHREEQIILNF